MTSDRGSHVFLIANDAWIRVTIRRELTTARGHSQVIEVADRDDLIAALASASPHDLIVIAIDETAFFMQTVASVQEQMPNIPLILIRIEENGRIAIEAVRHGVADDMRLSKDASRDRDHLRTLHAIDRALVTMRDMDALLDRIMTEISAALHVSRCSIWLLDRTGEWLRGRSIGTLPGEPDVTQIRLSRQEPLVEHLFRTRQPVIVLDTADPSYEPLLNQNYVAAFNIRAFLAVPLLRRERMIGFIVLDDSRQARKFSHEEIDLAVSVAAQAAVAIENVMLLEEAQHRAEEMSTLRQLAVELTQQRPSLDVILPTLLARVVALVHADAANLWLWNGSRQKLQLAHGFGFDPVTRETELAPGEGLAGQVLIQEKPIVLNEYQDWPNHLHWTDPTSVRASLHATIGVPLLGRERPIGVLVVGRMTPGYIFDSNDQHLLELFAQQAAGVIENARLYEELERRVRQRTVELERANDELRRFARVAVGRELRMVELKEEIKRLRQQLREMAAAGQKEDLQ
ncbi:MAG TPA: GAF domain-containing protein [Anaerolineae bacterium]|nr:GAF domain-containing protein [Anaerolineae bacterium]